MALTGRDTGRTQGPAGTHGPAPGRSGNGPARVWEGCYGIRYGSSGSGWNVSEADAVAGLRPGAPAKVAV